MVEAAAATTALWAWVQGHRGRPRLLRTSAEFHHPVHPPTARLEHTSVVRGKRHLQFATTAIHVGAVQVAKIETVLGVFR